MTELEFYHALLKTPGGEIDVVIPPELIEDSAKLQKDYILTEHFWLSARASD